MILMSNGQGSKSTNPGSGDTKKHLQNEVLWSQEMNTMAWKQALLPWLGGKRVNWKGKGEGRIKTVKTGRNKLHYVF